MDLKDPERRLFLNDRITFGKAKIQFGFYVMICLPMYAVMAKAFPPLDATLNGVKKNLEQWKALSMPKVDE
jgi:hypothetical protein